MSTALLSAYNKDGLLVDFASGLMMLGYNLFGSAGTAAYLNDSGVPAQACDLEKGASMVKALKVDLVCVSLCPPTEEVENAQKVVKIDTDGLMLLLYAVSGRRLVLSSSQQFPVVLKYIREQSQLPLVTDEHEKFISWLAWQAESAVAQYCLISANYHYERAQSHD